MSLLHNLATTTATLLLLISAPSAVAGNARFVLVHCTAPQPDSLCAALKQALIEERPDYHISDASHLAPDPTITIRYQENARADTWVSGALEWETSEGATGTGPTIEQTVMDGLLQADDLARYARALVKSTELPF